MWLEVSWAFELGMDMCVHQRQLYVCFNYLFTGTPSPFLL